jgi:hypothetical protein
VQRLPVDAQVRAHARPQRAGAGIGPRAQRVVILALVNAGEDAAERGGVRAARPPGPVRWRAQVQQQLLRRGRGPFRSRAQLPVPGHARDLRQRQHVFLRVHAALPPAGVTGTPSCWWWGLANPWTWMASWLSGFTTWGVRRAG